MAPIFHLGILGSISAQALILREINYKDFLYLFKE